jgi:hypothetical protein
VCPTEFGQTTSTVKMRFSNFSTNLEFAYTGSSNSLAIAKLRNFRELQAKHKLMKLKALM